MLPPSLQQLAERLSKKNDWKPGEVVRQLRACAVRATDLEPWYDFDHPVRDGYGRKLAYKADAFEIMVMSWRPGDFAAIHDHGQATWGAVQIFGEAEHATFRIDGDITTLARWTVEEGAIIGVSHALVHQMGNPSRDQFFVSLHVYGCEAEADSITADARIYNLQDGTIQRVDGGVFFALPEDGISRVEEGPAADFPTRLRHMIELIRRLRRMESAGERCDEYPLDAIYREAFSAEHRTKLLCCLKKNTNASDKQTNSVYWRALNRELREAAVLQQQHEGRDGQKDSFHRYAELYDALIGRPCMTSFMEQYLLFFRDQYNIDFSGIDIISLGCGTALVEQFMLNELGARHDRLYGIDYSDAMVQEARKRIHADQGDVLTLDPNVRQWDLAYSGLNVFHYLDHTRLQEAIERTAAIVNPGGYFVADFITPDHIRWYPNVAYSADKRVISLRTPELLEEDGSMFLESEITNVSFLDERLEVTYAGKHRRFLPPMHRVRDYLARAFGTEPMLYDAKSLAPLSALADSCQSTRYIAIVQRALPQ